MLSAYAELHRAGHAHSFEARLNGVLVAGMYGVYVDGCFAGESMFTEVSNGSKLCLIYAIETLQQLGLRWIDIQVLTPHMSALGAELIPRAAFLALLKASQNTKAAPLIPKS